MVRSASKNRLALGALGVFAFAERRGLSHEAARTLVVNTVVVMEIFYLFSVRYLRTGSVTLQGVLGAPAVLIGVGATCLLQLAFTYLPIMQTLFETRSIAVTDGLAIIGVGIVMLAVIDVGETAPGRRVDQRLDAGRRP